MNREILFRGKRVDNGEWVYGGYYHTTCYIKVNDYIMQANGKSEGVDPDTVGQYTGLKDKCGTRIFEGDVVEWDSKEWGYEHREVVEWDYELLDMRKNDWKEWCKVVGNIHDNTDMA